ncbi:MAG: hypothetical protein ABSD98_02545 [Candidatus Korobacteraceae bacterium]|jgi:hypothetical protein
MESSENNPGTNQIGPGVDEARIVAAVEESGYPLQTAVTEILRPTFEHIQQEWSYLDKTSNELRAIDVFAEKRLHDWHPQPRVRPTLNLIIECKHSNLPYVFFKTSDSVHLLRFPAVAGLPSDTVEITTDDDLSTWTIPIISVLGLSGHPFHQGPSYCSTFSKCVRKGGDLELSGADPYCCLVLPLIKAIHHFEVAEQPVKTAWYFDAHLVMAVGVLDASIITATQEKGGTVLTLAPWVRVLRHEYSEDYDHWERQRLSAIDIVHKDFLQAFLTTHLLPFSERFSERALRHQVELATGKGFISRMGTESWDGLESRLGPRPMLASRTGTKNIATRLLGFLRRQGEE